jgi:hypothetical protein
MLVRRTVEEMLPTHPLLAGEVCHLISDHGFSNSVNLRGTIRAVLRVKHTAA